VTKRINHLHGLGVRVALDDFGSGYSKLGYLQRFPLDKLKIDKSFVAALGRSSNGGVIIQAIVALGRALGLSVLVEGVETEHRGSCSGWPAVTRCRASCSPGRRRPRQSTGFWRRPSWAPSLYRRQARR
jgi:predicted signal transduction protein with EAL and GGDEF domain